jgi:hypothetical protein
VVLGQELAMARRRRAGPEARPWPRRLHPGRGQGPPLAAVGDEVADVLATLRFGAAPLRVPAVEGQGHRLRLPATGGEGRQGQ